MSGEAAKERVTPVPSKSGLLTYFRFGKAQCASCGLSPTRGYGRIASTRNSDFQDNKQEYFFNFEYQTETH